MIELIEVQKVIVSGISEEQEIIRQAARLLKMHTNSHILLTKDGRVTRGESVGIYGSEKCRRGWQKEGDGWEMIYNERMLNAERETLKSVVLTVSHQLTNLKHVIG